MNEISIKISAVGAALAVGISWALHHSIGWALVHGLLGWVYVGYYIADKV